MNNYCGYDPNFRFALLNQAKAELNTATVGTTMAAALLLMDTGLPTLSNNLIQKSCLVGMVRVLLTQQQKVTTPVAMRARSGGRACAHSKRVHLRMRTQ